ncbi:PKSKA1, partial [Chaetomium sp. MPI-SDFR-AT-0129]
MSPSTLASLTSTSSTSPADSAFTSKCTSDDGLTGVPIAGRGPVDAGHRTQVPIAVVGMGCRLPGHSNSPTQLWEFLQRGGVAKNEPPASRFNLGGHYDGTRRPRTMKSPGGMFLEDVDVAEFDGQFFNISRVDCIAMDPQQRQILEVAYECLESAGISLQKLSGTTTGVIVGTNFIDYGAIQNRDPEDRADSITIGLASSILSNRVSHFLNVNGPSMTIDTACSASLVSVDVACRYLDSFQADGMIVGGANLWLTPEHNQEVGMMNMTQSGSGRCHSFDAKGDGYVKAEGINVVYLKRLDDAIRDGDPIRAVLRGTAANASGRTAGLANPSPDMQAAVTRTAYRNAGIDDFLATQFLECHGTGTLAGDPVEVQGAASVFSSGRKPGQELVIGSIKSNIGHSEAAAGISGLLKAIMAVERGVIPGNPTFITPNPKIDWKTSMVRATRTSIKWPGSGPLSSPIRRASVNSFGFGGANAHAVVENYHSVDALNHVSSYKQITTNFFDDDDEDSDDDNDDKEGGLARPMVLVLSANSQTSLTANARALSSHLLNPMVSVERTDLAYTLSERRSRHYYRGFVVSRSANPKGSIGEEALVTGKQASSQPKIGFVFTGQGAQWPQMGAELVSSFPRAKRTIEDLDEVLQALPEPPSWTLLEELTAVRTPEALRQPEFSQPLVTALQLAQLDVLNSWGIRPVAVVGHSSGEIAAAAAAGLMTYGDAIKTAYYRGKAAKLAKDATTAAKEAEPVGMLAVGIGADAVEPFLRPDEGKVQIACYNSPSSLTMSGTASALGKLCGRLKEAGHFARMLLVDLAYHSDYMAEIGDVYEQLLLRDEDLFRNPNPDTTNTSPDTTTTGVRMFSSVTGGLLPPTDRPDAVYWKTNMVSPVKFDHAASALLRDADHGADFLIELGPSNALAGPVGQIKKTIGGSTDAPYTSVLKRGADSTLAMYDAAGRLFLAGGDVDLASVNEVSQRNAKVIVDLPGYAWDHSVRYWHETRASSDWRFKKFINHDLLGSKVPGTPWQTPLFKKVLRVADVPWLRDHKLGSDIVFPAAAYVAMAVEAAFQTAMVTQWSEQIPARHRFRLRDVKLLRALVLDEAVETRLTLSLNPIRGGLTRSWFEFQVCSQQDGLPVDPVHSTGRVCVETDYEDTPATADEVAPLQLATSAQIWYKALADLGYKFGPYFQKHKMVEATIGQRKSRSIVDLEAPPSHPGGQSTYPLHPAVMDSCFQAASPALWKGDLPSPGAAVLVPKLIDTIVIEGYNPQLPAEGVALASASFLGVGSPENPRNYATNVRVHNPLDGGFLFEMRGLSSGEMQTADNDDGNDGKTSHTFTRLAWNADVDLLMSSTDDAVARDWFQTKTAADLMDAVAHKTPGLNVLELNLDVTDASSLWMTTDGQPNPVRAAASQYHLAVREAKVLIQAQEQLSSRTPSPQFHLASASKPASVAGDTKFDLVIVKGGPEAGGVDEEGLLTSLTESVREGGFIVTSSLGLYESGLGRLGKHFALAGQNTTICQVKAAATATTEGTTTDSETRPTIVHVSLFGSELQAQHEQATSSILATVSARNQWDIKTLANPVEEITSEETVVVVLDELFAPVMDTLDARQWDILKHITGQRCRLLWLTAGAQLEVEHPLRAAIVGLLRTIRAEEQLHLSTLDLPSTSSTEATASALSAVLERLLLPSGPSTATDYEFASRNGILHTARVVPDAALTQLQGSDDVATEDLHASDTLVQLRCERLGNVDSVHFAEAETEVATLADDAVEVELYAAGLNYKDVVVTMGIVPGDETQLGHEAAGIVRRVGKAVTDYSVGERVVVFGKGTFANRVRTTPARMHRIPDSMSFEEVATMSVVYLTSLYSLFDVGKLSAGKRVLIHSAAGGVGIAAIQLARSVGADVFATVGTPEKREFLWTTFGLGDDRVFNSRNTDFGDQILAATAGEGVDVVLNSLTGDMLAESFRILRDNGIMVEIGKRDILDRNDLPMAPFDRNISFRAVDFSPERAPDALVSRLFSKLFALLEWGHIKPINPIHRYSWTDIPAAIRFLRAGKHIGKIVLSDGGAEAKIQIRKAPKQLTLRDDGSYLIVGGLRGLCGSLAIYLAKSGAKHLAVMSRSGYNDDKSRYVVKQVTALGAHIDLLTADVTNAAQVDAAFRQTKAPITGIIQGAMVLRDRPFDSMTLTEYHEAFACKVQGTWNLHNTADALGLQLDFFTLLSSISGVVGNRGQANYAAANTFLDAFAEYRRARGQAACSVDLGVIEDAGVIAENSKLHEQFDPRVFKGINDGLLRRILCLSLLQQQDGTASQAHAQIITGLIASQPADSLLAGDARFSALFNSAQEGGGNKVGGGGGDADVQALLVLLQSKSADPAARLKATVEVVNGCFVRMLRLAEPMDPARPLSVYGIDSLAAVEVRNWVRAQLGAFVTTLDIMNAASLTAFCDKIIAKVT